MNLFAYGILTIPEVIEALLKRAFTSRPAVLHGFRRWIVAGENYPAIIRNCGSLVSGVVYFDLSDEDFKILDEFEYHPYQRTIVSAALTDHHPVNAAAYIFPDECDELLSSVDWDEGYYRANHLTQMIHSITNSPALIR